MQVILVFVLGAVGVALLVGAIMLLNREDSPAERDKKVKNQIIEEMLATAVTEEEKSRIMAMTEGAAPQDYEEQSVLYGIDSKSKDTLDKIIASQLQYAARRDDTETGDDTVQPQQDMQADAAADENIDLHAALKVQEALAAAEAAKAAEAAQKAAQAAAEAAALESVLAKVNQRSEQALAELAKVAGIETPPQEALQPEPAEEYKTGLFAYDNMSGEPVTQDDFLTATQSLDIPDVLRKSIDQRIKGIEGGFNNGREKTSSEKGNFLEI